MSTQSISDFPNPLQSSVEEKYQDARQFVCLPPAPNSYTALRPCDTKRLVKRFFHGQEDWGRKKIRSHIFQVCGFSYAKGTVIEPATTKKRGNQRYQPSKRVDEWLEVAREIITQRGYKKVAVITHMVIEKRVREGLGLAAEDTLHFYKLRGRNDFKGYEVVFILGTPYPNLRSILNAAIALDPSRAYELVRTVANGIPLPPYLPTQREFRFSQEGLKQFQTEHGQDCQGAARVVGSYEDPVLRMVLESLRESELLQAVYRARPQSNPADVWLFSDIPLDIELDGLWESAPIAPAGLTWPTWKKIRAWHEVQPEGAAYGYSELEAGTKLSLSGLKHLKALDIIAEYYGAAVERTRAKTEGADRPREVIRKNPI